MIRKRLSRLAAAAVLVGLGSLAASPAWAIDVPLPGERKIEVHGFYELRVRGFFRNNPFGENGTTLSQFRHVLDLETDIDIAPEGVGPFDYLGGFTRWQISYECVYERACGLFKSANSFGGNNRNVSRLPANFKTARTRKSDIGGLVPAPFLPGTRIRNGGHNPNPGRRFTSCFIPDGMFATAYPIGAFCNLNTRTRLDQPIFPTSITNALSSGFKTQEINAQRAGSTNADLGTSQLTASRAFLQGANLGSLASILARPALSKLGSATANFQLAESARLRQNAAFLVKQANQIRSRGGPVSQAEALENAARQKQRGADDELFKGAGALLNKSDQELRTLGSDQVAALLRDPRKADLPTRQASLPLLPTARPDPDRFGQLSRLQAPDLISAVWGVTHFSDTNVPWLANLNAAIRPGGYFTKPFADTVSQFAFGLGRSLDNPEFQLAFDPRCTSEQRDKNTCPTNVRVTFRDSRALSFETLGQLAQFYGPDGVTGTADDLPLADSSGTGKVKVHMKRRSDGVLFGFVKLEDGTLFKDADLRLAAAKVDVGTSKDVAILPDKGNLDRNVVVKGDQEVEIFRVLEENIGDPNDPEVRARCRKQLQADPRFIGLAGGVNKNRNCIVLATSDKANRDKGVFKNSLGQPLQQFAAVAALADPAFRPGSAVFEPTDLTDLAGRSGTLGRGLPARPPNPQGGLFFRSFGYDKLIKDHTDVIGDLDLNFDEDELRWDHGASQDENEFREGYLEGEFWDSQIFFRVGKLLMVWGKTELFRNQDRLNPLDIGIGTLARLEEARIGQWAADVTFSPEAWMNVGPAKDVRLEFVMLFDNFQPTDLGKCGESLTFSLVCGLAFGSEAHGLTGIGVAGLVNPYHNYAGLKRFDYAARLEGRFDRFTFALTDFWGWDDSFLLDTVQQYARSVDVVTGAPVVSTGGSCRIRRNAQGQAVGPDGRHVSDVGGSLAAAGRTHPFNLDDNVPSVGNCLLWEDNGEADGIAQSRRDPGQVALLHSANQTLFHTICTLTFDEDSGRCALDLTNDIFIGKFVAQILGGIPGDNAANLGAQGFDTIKRPDRVSQGKAQTGAQSSELFSNVRETVLVGDQLPPVATPDVSLLLTDPNQTVFDPKVPEDRLVLDFADKQFGIDLNTKSGLAKFKGQFNSLSQTVGGLDPVSSFQTLSTDQKGLLGCGPDFLSFCEEVDAIAFQFNPTLSDALGFRQDFNFPFGGIDFLNADASVLTQEFTPLKAYSPGAPVGSRGGVRGGGSNPQDGLQFEAGITTEAAIRKAVGDDLTPGTADDPITAKGEDGIAGTRDDPIFSLHKTEKATVKSPLLGSTFGADSASKFVYATDYQIEPQRWALDPKLAEQGIIVFQIDPNHPNDPNASDPNHPTVFSRDASGRPIGENCTPTYGGPDPGCTSLEIISANLERLFITNEIKGGDNSFDPAETLHELSLMLDGDPSTDFRGDPISGPDGITFADFIRTDGGNDSALNRSFYNYLSDDPNGAPIQLDLSTYQKRIPVVVGTQAVDKITECTPNSACFLRLPSFTRDSAGNLQEVVVRDQANNVVQEVGALPLAIAGQEVGKSGKFLLALQEMNPSEIQKIAAAVSAGVPSVAVDVVRRKLLAGNVVDSVSETAHIELQITTTGRGGRKILLLPDLLGQDKDIRSSPENGLLDLDENRDGQLDFLDDGTAGPISDDNPLCGSGIPGDILQDAPQVALAPVEQKEFEANGGLIPPRSPVFCKGVSGLLGVTGQTLPRLRAGGNGQFGRRDFIWHGGQEVALKFQKRNVVGLSLDFAHGPTKTSWGIEATWTPDKLFGDSRARDGLHESDEYDLTISVDRPSFFNFLNPNRSFFINFQFFLRYFSNFVGGRANKDGMFGTAGGSLDGIVTLTFFTGYFQDRLQPRMTALYSPRDGSAAVLTGMSYRYNDKFSTSIGLNHFFLTRGATQGLDRDFPIALRGRNDPTSEIFRGVSAVRNRDVGVLTIRYTF